MSKREVWIVDWVDAVASAGWTDDGDAPKPVRVRSVGFKVRESKDYVVLATSVDGDVQHNATITIPSGMITKARRVR